MDELGIDVMVAGSQKAFMIPTGLSFIALSARAWRVQKTARTPRFYFDLAAERAANARGETLILDADAVGGGFEPGVGARARTRSRPIDRAVPGPGDRHPRGRRCVGFADVLRRAGAVGHRAGVSRRRQGARASGTRAQHHGDGWSGSIEGKDLTRGSHGRRAGSGSGRVVRRVGRTARARRGTRRRARVYSRPCARNPPCSNDTGSNICRDWANRLAQQRSAR